MGKSLAQIYVHIIFRKKNTASFLKPSIMPELYNFMTHTAQEYDSTVLTINGTGDHVHILLRLSKTCSISSIIEQIKKKSSRWIKHRGSIYRNFYWQRGYGAFSVGQSGIQNTIHYIRKQAEHHARKSYKEEFLEFLTKYGLDCDETYLWDD